MSRPPSIFIVTCAGTDPAAFCMVNTHVPEMSIFDWAVAAAPQMIIENAGHRERRGSSGVHRPILPQI